MNRFHSNILVTAIAGILCVVTAVSSVLITVDMLPNQLNSELSIPFGEEAADTSGQENLNPENEDKIFEEPRLKSFSSQLLKWMSFETDIPLQRVYRTIPSPPPDLA
ncbi:hypothetical protein AB2B38_012550 [Balneola sp. MJW-20]|uniref:hypothetical protein n=1 Tax=Gracilimonas aurantiaca TaxID=3234185 RepID=UPI00346731C1